MFLEFLQVLQNLFRQIKKLFEIGKKYTDSKIEININVEVKENKNISETNNTSDSIDNSNNLNNTIIFGKNRWFKKLEISTKNLKFLHGIGQAFNFATNNKGEIVWQPLMDYNKWLGKQADIVTVWNSNNFDTWDGIKGGEGTSDNVWSGQLARLNPNRAFDSNYWPKNKPVVFCLTAVPKSHSNAFVNNKWSRPQIWQRIAQGTCDRIYKILFRRIARKCGDTGRNPETLVIRWCWEANGTWYTHSIGPDMHNFKEAWKRVFDIATKECENVLGKGKRFLFEFGPSGHLKFGENWGKHRLADIYPGDNYVDICGLGIHDQIGIKNINDWNKYLKYPANIAGTIFEGYYCWFDFATSRNKLIGTSEIECNYVERQYFPKTENTSAFWQGFGDLVQKYIDKFVYCVYLWNGASSMHNREVSWGEPYKQFINKFSA